MEIPCCAQSLGRDMGLVSVGTVEFVSRGSPAQDGVHSVNSSVSVYFESELGSTAGGQSECGCQTSRARSYVRAGRACEHTVTAQVCSESQAAWESKSLSPDKGGPPYWAKENRDMELWGVVGHSEVTSDLGAAISRVLEMWLQRRVGRRARAV